MVLVKKNSKGLIQIVFNNRYFIFYRRCLKEIFQPLTFLSIQ